MGVIKINGVTYGGGDNSVMLTQAEYDALVEAGTVDPTVLYMITDKNSENTAYAATVSYANTDSGLSATNVQEAIDELAPVKSSIGNIADVDLTNVQAGDLMQWQSVNGTLKLVPYNISSLKSSLILANFAVYSAERILNNATKSIPLTQNLFVLFFKSYSQAGCYGAYLISYHPSVASSQYISTLVQGSSYIPTLSISGSNLVIATGGTDIYYSMLRLN